jgi:hypothetical protein
VSVKRVRDADSFASFTSTQLTCPCISQVTPSRAGGSQSVMVPPALPFS